MIVSRKLLENRLKQFDHFITMNQKKLTKEVEEIKFETNHNDGE